MPHLTSKDFQVKHLLFMTLALLATACDASPLPEAYFSCRPKLRVGELKEVVHLLNIDLQVREKVIAANKFWMLNIKPSLMDHRPYVYVVELEGPFMYVVEASGFAQEISKVYGPLPACEKKAIK